MEELDWCKKQKKGIDIVDSNLDIAKGYLKMAEDAIGTMNREKDKNLVFSVSAGYYCIYYSLYSIMQKIGVKCEIHSCSILFAKKFLEEFYSNNYFDLMDVAFSLRNNFQYYVGKSFNKKDLESLWAGAYPFFVKSRKIFSILSEKQINNIKEKLNE